MRLDHLLSKEKVEGSVSLLSYQRIAQRFLAAIRPGETPVPIPNTTVKAWAADGTALETAWESRRLPDPLKMPIGGFT